MTELALGEAVPLGYALVARVARDAGVRALAIKGPVPSLQGLRQPRVSVDVDIWVDPAHHALVCRRMRSLGWQQRLVPTSAQVLTLHSVTVAHPQWPCEIDIHDRYPGFLADPQVVFDYVWSTRADVELAGVVVASPSVVGSAAIQVLQFLRDNGLRTDPEVDDLIARTARELDTESGRADLRDLAMVAGAASTLRPLFESLGMHVADDGAHDEELRAWHLALDDPGAKAVPAVYELLNAPWRRRPRLLWRSLWLTEAEIREKQPGAGPTWRGLLVARLRRLWWGVTAMPGAVRQVWRSRHR